MIKIGDKIRLSDWSHNYHLHVTSVTNGNVFGILITESAICKMTLGKRAYLLNQPWIKLNKQVKSHLPEFL